MAPSLAWLAEHHQIPVSLFLEQEGDRIYLHLFGRSGLPLGRARERKLEHAVAQGDVLSCRGLGKCVLTEVGGPSKKGRILIVLERYV